MTTQTMHSDTGVLDSGVVEGTAAGGGAGERGDWGEEREACSNHEDEKL